MTEGVEQAGNIPLTDAETTPTPVPSPQGEGDADTAGRPRIVRVGAP